MKFQGFCYAERVIQITDLCSFKISIFQHMSLINPSHLQLSNILVRIMSENVVSDVLRLSNNVNIHLPEYHHS